MKLVRMRKTNQWEWFDAVQAGKLTGAIKTLNPAKRGGPYTVLCDGEGLLHAKMLQPLYRRKNIVLWQCPAKSPDLKPRGDVLGMDAQKASQDGHGRPPSQKGAVGQSSVHSADQIGHAFG